MTQILALADIHVDIDQATAVNPVTGRRVWWEENMACVHAALQAAMEHGVAAIIIAGDLFKAATPTIEAQGMLADELRQVARASIPVVIISGNHELLHKPIGQRNVLDRFGDIPGVSVYTQPGVAHVPGLPPIACLPWPQDDPANMQRDLEAACDLAPRGSLLVAHGTVSGVLPGHMVNEATEAILQGSWVKQQDHFAHIILGHIHARQMIGERAHYVGSSQVFTADEYPPKAASLIELDDDPPSIQAIELPARRLVTLTYDELVQSQQDLQGTWCRVLVQTPDQVIPARQAVEKAGGRVIRVVISPPEASGALLQIPKALPFHEQLDQYVQQAYPDLSDSDCQRVQQIVDELLAASASAD